MSGKLVQLPDFKGKVVYLDFWASWCKPCIAEVEPARKIRKHFKNQDNLVFINISTDTNKENWFKAVGRYNMEDINLRDNETAGKTVTEYYGIIGIPSSFIIDRNGNFHAIQPPLPSHNGGKDLIKVLEEALAK